MSDEELRRLEKLASRLPKRLHAHPPEVDEWYGLYSEIRTAKERFKGSLVALTEPDKGETIVALLKAVPELLAEIRRLKALVAERERGEAS